MPSQRAPAKDKFLCRYVDMSGSASVDGKPVVLMTETRPSPREHHPGTRLRLPSRAGGGSIVEAFVLRSRIDLVRREQTTFVHKLDGIEADGAARKYLEAMTLAEIWQTLLNLATGNSVFALEACVAVVNRRPPT